ncbi:MAG: MBOAT family O-acyltransferase [Flavobacteriales bacterium]
MWPLFYLDLAMLFNSFVFFIFLVFIWVVFLSLKNKQKGRVYWILFSSYLFYGYWEWKFLLLIFLSTIIDFLIGQKIEDSGDEIKSKRWLILSMVLNLTILGFFKYYNFFISSFIDFGLLFNLKLSAPILNILLPVGISFYTFQTMSYSIDIYRKRIKAERNIAYFALFIAFYPQLVAGPIERAEHMFEQFKKRFFPTKQQCKEGFHLIALGLFKKVMIGDTLGRIVDELFSEPESFYSLELIAGVILFGLQIYADFSGYTQIARGTSKLLGVELMKNFSQPYLSTSITEFWRRWHISLSSWLKDYLYISLGGNRNGRTKINLMLTMVIGGLWHGANWTFIVWGFLHGSYLIIHKKVMSKNLKLNYWLSWILTQFLVFYAWLFFRANSIGDALLIHKQILKFEYSFEGVLLLKTSLIIGALVFVLDCFERKTVVNDVLLQFVKRKSVRVGISLSFIIISFMYMFQNKPLPFIYFQF